MHTESAIAKYDHVVQCLRELKIYRNAEMSESVPSPHTVSFTRSGLYVSSYAIYKSCLKGQSFFWVIWWKLVPSREPVKQLPVVTCPNAGIYWFEPDLACHPSPNLAAPLLLFFSPLVRGTFSENQLTSTPSGKSQICLQFEGCKRGPSLKFCPGAGK